MNDREILALFFARSEDAIAALLEKYGRLLHRIAMNILRCESDAEECASDTALAVWDTVPPAEPDSLSAYAGRIARNLALDRYRYNHAARRFGGGDMLLEEAAEIVSGEASAEDEAMRRALAGAISDFLRQQGETDRNLFVRRYWYGDGVADLAAEFGIAPNSAAVRLHRMSEKLRKLLSGKGFIL